MKSFNFFHGYNNDISSDEYDFNVNLSNTQIASWVWEDHIWPNIPPNHQLRSITVDGIIEFLYGFNPTTVVIVRSIYCPTFDILHYSPRVDDERGWGFNIQRETIRIEYYHNMGE